jgi:hypothetical protein
MADDGIFDLLEKPGIGSGYNTEQYYTVSSDVYHPYLHKGDRLRFDAQRAWKAELCLYRLVLLVYPDGKTEPGLLSTDIQPGLYNALFSPPQRIENSITCCFPIVSIEPA